VQDGTTGRIACDEDFATAIAETLADPARFAAMRSAARAHAMQCSWDAVFQRVVDAYSTAADLHTGILNDEEVALVNQ
jgi:hypothetical protein